MRHASAATGGRSSRNRPSRRYPTRWPGPARWSCEWGEPEPVTPTCTSCTNRTRALPWELPFTLGHENAGWAHAVGEGVTNVRVGQAVAVYGPWGCGTRARCQLGIETLCENPAEAPVAGGGGGLGLDGGMADLMLVPNARQLVALPDGLEPVTAAPLTDAGLTPYHAVRRSWPKLTPTSTVVVIGVGGLGHLGVQILRATTGAWIIAVDTRPEALRLAVESGADQTVTAGDTAAAEIRDATQGLGADVVLDFVGSDITLALAAAVVRNMGDITIVGIGGGTLTTGFFQMPYDVSVQTTYWGSRPSCGGARAGRSWPAATEGHHVHPRHGRRRYPPDGGGPARGPGGHRARNCSAVVATALARGRLHGCCTGASWWRALCSPGRSCSASCPSVLRQVAYAADRVVGARRRCRPHLVRPRGRHRRRETSATLAIRN